MNRALYAAAGPPALATIGPKAKVSVLLFWDMVCPLLSDECRQPCTDVGCEVITSFTASDDEMALVAQHGPNPEHVTFIDAALGRDHAMAHLIGWLRRIHPPEVAVA